MSYSSCYYHVLAPVNDISFNKRNCMGLAVASLDLFVTMTCTVFIGAATGSGASFGATSVSYIFLISGFGSSVYSLL